MHMYKLRSLSKLVDSKYRFVFSGIVINHMKCERKTFIRDYEVIVKP